jgi:hypothetical protein
VDEREWERCSDPGRMLAFFEAKADSRKLRFFACTCARRVWDQLTDQRSRQAVVIAEQYADGQVSRAALDRAQHAAQRARDSARGDPTAADIAQYCAASEAQTAAWNVADLMVSWAVWQHASESPAATRKGFRAEKAEMKRLCDLLRELFGDPFRSEVKDKRCREPKCHSAETNPLTAKAKVKELVSDVISGSDLPTAWERLGMCGKQGVDALLDALEGKSGPVPEGRDPRDLHDDLSGGLQAIAKVNPEPLLRALDRRPRHTFSLIWALGSSREQAAVQTLIAYAKHNEKWVRWAAVEGLSRLRRKSLLQPLLEALRDRSEMVRFTALEGLVKVANRTAIEPLKRYLNHKRLPPGGRRIAGELLGKLEQSRK